MPSSITPNMSLIVPTVGQEPGPQYATDVNGDLNIIDSHNHTPGFGVPVPTAGLNINADLAMNNNRSLLLKSATFTPQGSPLSGISPDIGALYVSGVDLYYNDVNGNQIRMTQNGSISGTSGSISGLTSPASASYNSGTSTFIWQSDVNTSAAMDNGPVTIRQISVNAKGITLQSPNSLAADYSLVFMPALPGANNTVIGSDTAGNLSNKTYDAVGQGMTAIGANAVANSRTRSTGSPTEGVGGIAISSSCGNFSSSSLSYVDITNLNVTLTTSGRPVMVMLIPDSSGNLSSVYAAASTGFAEIFASIENLTTAVSANYQFGSQALGAQPEILIPPASFTWVDTSVAGLSGTYNYKVQAVLNQGSSFGFTYLSLIAYEL